MRVAVVVSSSMIVLVLMLGTRRTTRAVNKRTCLAVLGTNVLNAVHNVINGSVILKLLNENLEGIEGSQSTAQEDETGKFGDGQVRA
jgi:hypothetical protein